MAAIFLFRAASVVRQRRLPAHFSRGVDFFDAASVGSPDLTHECVDTALFVIAAELRPSRSYA